MRFKIDENFKAVAAYYPQFPQLADGLCRGLAENGFISTDPDGDVYGRKVSDVMGEFPVSHVAAFLMGFFFGGKKPIPAGMFAAFCNLIVMDDYDCPVCGGFLEYVATEGHELNDGDHNTPNSWVPDLYVYRCAYCGEIIKTPNEL